VNVVRRKREDQDEHDIQNGALFEPFKLFPKHPRPINLADPELLRVLAIHHLEIDSR
jgi:hypothetical protein